MLVKTLVMMDNGPSSNEAICSIIFEQKAAGNVGERHKVTRSTLNCMMEAAAEYTRVVSDLFPDESLVRIGLTHPKPAMITGTVPLRCSAMFDAMRKARPAQPAEGMATQAELDAAVIGVRAGVGLPPLVLCNVALVIL
eukprot:gene2593-24089_t